MELVLYVNNALSVHQEIYSWMGNIMLNFFRKIAYSILILDAMDTKPDFAWIMLKELWK